MVSKEKKGNKKYFPDKRKNKKEQTFYDQEQIVNEKKHDKKKHSNTNNNSRKQQGKKNYTIWQQIQKYKEKYINRHMLLDLLINPFYLYFAACLFLVAEVFMNILIIENVKYTEIDWRAYMQEVEGFINGTYDYTKLKGDTGPLVYPAGFVYIFSALYYITEDGKNIRLAQYIFAGIYLLMLAFIFRIYHKSKKLPPYILVFVCCLSYRIHSIFVLRLFNDTIAMTIFYGAVNLFISGWWSLGSIFYSLAVSVKMNILLFAPALFLSYLYCLGFYRTILQLFICASIQVILGAPFLMTNAVGYLTNAFNLGRIFLYEWTVNWRFLPEDIFVNGWFHAGLLSTHVILLALFAFTHWRRYLVHLSSLQSAKLDASSQLLLGPLFMSNFIGIAFSRSLHYQFYVWYFHSIPYLLWSTKLSVIVRILVMGLIELCWNTFPSTWWSSALLHFCHLVILIGLIWNRPSQQHIQTMKKRLLKGD